MSRAMKSLDPVYSRLGAVHDEPGDKDLDLKGDNDSPQPGVSQDRSSWFKVIGVFKKKNVNVSLHRSEQCIMGRLVPPH